MLLDDRSPASSRLSQLRLLQTLPSEAPVFAPFASDWTKDHIEEVKANVVADMAAFNMDESSRAEWNTFFDKLPLTPADVPEEDRPVWNMSIENSDGVRAAQRVTYSNDMLERLRLALVESHKSDSDYISHSNFRGLERMTAIRELEEQATAMMDFAFEAGRQFLIYQQLWKPPGHATRNLFLSLGRILKIHGARETLEFDVEFHSKTSGTVDMKWEMDAEASYKPFFSEGERTSLKETISIKDVISVGHTLTKGGRFTKTRPHKNRLTSHEVAARDITTWLQKREHLLREMILAEAAQPEA